MSTSSADADPLSIPSWRPTASGQMLKARAALLSDIRTFFQQRNVLEVDTPVLSKHGTTDPYIESISAGSGWLQTSPEFAMKRLLCAGSGSIYQIAKAFRQGECGRWHNPEFSMLEWYRLGYTHDDLIKEVDAFLQATLETEPAYIVSYQHVFLDTLNLDPLACSEDALVALVDTKNVLSGNISGLSRDDLLNFLFTHFIEPSLGQERPTIIYGYPASQSALARINQQDPRIADRFEAYYQGVELANGFYELADPVEQYRRFQSDLQQRQLKGLTSVTMDKYLIEALTHGLPDCAGVALGIDRLLMLKVGAKHINEVLCFPFERA